MSKNKPVHEIRLGRIRAAVWQNETEAGVRRSVTFTRLYKDGEQWKSASSFGADDLLVLAAVCTQMRFRLEQQRQASRQEGSQEQEVEQGESQDIPF